jgi:superoxide dismutase
MATYTLPRLPDDYGGLEPHGSGRIMELHRDKHHAGYVKAANETLERLDDARFKAGGPLADAPARTLTLTLTLDGAAV